MSIASALRVHALRIAGVVGTLAALSGVIAFALMHKGPPVRLVSELADTSGNVLLNNTKMIRLPISVLDRRGRALEAKQVRYAWRAGSAVQVSPTGVLQCTGRGDAVVRATLDGLATDLAVRCRPIDNLRAATWMDLIAGGEPVELAFEGLDPDGVAVGEVRAKLRIGDTTIATLEGLNVRPRAVGETNVTIAAGDRRTGTRILVNEMVSSFEHLRPDQSFVARQLKLAQGDTVRWPLEKGVVWLKYLPAREGEPPPTISVAGDAQCQLANPLQRLMVAKDEIARLCSVYGPASVELAHGRIGMPFVEGFVMLDRSMERFSPPKRR